MAVRGCSVIPAYPLRYVMSRDELVVLGVHADQIAVRDARIAGQALQIAGQAGTSDVVQQ